MSGPHRAPGRRRATRPVAVRERVPAEDQRAGRPERTRRTAPRSDDAHAARRPTRRRTLSGPALHRLLAVAWVVVVLLSCVGVVAVRLSSDVPELVREICVAVLSTALALGLAVRTGGRPVWAGGLAAAIATTALVTDWKPLLDGAAVGTGVVAATLGVMATVPAATVGRAVREVLLATVVGWVGALGVVGYGTRARLDVDLVRFGYAVLALSLIGAIALVYRLGAGLHGLGRRGYVIAAAAVFVLAFALAYSEAIAQWGSRDLVGTIDDFRDSTKQLLHAVPHPIMALLGYPALLWGVFMRARRRQGWWVCAFGVAVTAPTASRLVAQHVNATSVVLGAVYSVIAGVALGYLVIRIEHALTGTHGRRARRDEEAEAHRPEPSRFAALH